MKNNTIRQQLKLLLERAVVTDGDLFREISSITLVETEHANKIGSAKAAAKLQAQINQLQLYEKAEGKDKPLKKDEKKDNSMKDEVYALRAQVNELTNLMKNFQCPPRRQVEAPGVGDAAGGAAGGAVGVAAGGGLAGGAAGGAVPRGGGGRGGGLCRRCQQQNVNLRYCGHCFKCYAEGHKKNECPENA